MPPDIDGDPNVDAGGNPEPITPALQEPPDQPSAAELAAALETEREARRSDQLAAEGRIRKEQERAQRQAEFAARYGVQFDQEGNPAQFTPPYPGRPYQPAAEPEPEPEEFDWDKPQAEIDRRVDAKVREHLNQIVPQLVGLMDRSVEPILRMSVPDYEDIKPDFEVAVKTLGFQNVTHLRAANPALEELALNAARGAKLSRSAPAPVPAPAPGVQSPGDNVDVAALIAENERLRRLQATTTGGTAAPAGGTGNEWGELDADEIEEAKAMGIKNAEEYLAGFGPAKPLDRKSGGKS